MRHLIAIALMAAIAGPSLAGETTDNGPARTSPAGDADMVTGSIGPGIAFEKSEFIEPGMTSLIRRTEKLVVPAL